MHVEERCSAVALELADGADILGGEMPAVDLCTFGLRRHVPDVDRLERKNRIWIVYLIMEYGSIMNYRK